MARRSSWLPSPALKRAIQRNVKVFTKAALANGQRVSGKVQQAVADQARPPPGGGDWIAGLALGPGGARRYHLYRPPGLKLQRGHTLPLLVMLHGCGQTGRDFAPSRTGWPTCRAAGTGTSAATAKPLPRPRH